MILQTTVVYHKDIPTRLRFNPPPLSAFDSKERFVAFIVQAINSNASQAEDWNFDALDISYISAEIATEKGEEFKPPAWFKDCHGKIFFEPITNLWDLAPHDVAEEFYPYFPN